MGRLQRLGNLLGDRQRLIDRNRSLGNAIRQRRTFDELEDERFDAVRLLQPMNPADMWMVQRGKHLRFSLEPCEAIGIGGQGFRKNLERHLVELRVGGLIDLSHPALHDEGGHIVMAETGADG